MVVLGAALGSPACLSTARLVRSPLGASRETPPPEIAQRAAKVGEPAPLIVLDSSQGPFDLSKERRAVLVFYRGDW